MKKILVLLALSVSISVIAATTVSIEQLQGAWWSDTRNPTADFAIRGDEVWLDYDATYHPCKVEGDILIFELGKGQDPVKNRIISLQGDQMILENLQSNQVWILRREKP